MNTTQTETGYPDSGRRALVPLAQVTPPCLTRHRVRMLKRLVCRLLLPPAAASTPSWTISAGTKTRATLRALHASINPPIGGFIDVMNVLLGLGTALPLKLL